MPPIWGDGVKACDQYLKAAEGDAYGRGLYFAERGVYTAAGGYAYDTKEFDGEGRRILEVLLVRVVKWTLRLDQRPLSLEALCLV